MYRRGLFPSKRSIKGSSPGREVLYSVTNFISRDVMHIMTWEGTVLPPCDVTGSTRL